MTFRIKMGRQLYSEGKTFSAPVVAKKLNGYKVLNPDGNIAFLCLSDIDIISMSEDEKQMPVEL